ncbi:MAG: helix-turn-helix domain-containing protein [Denitrobacterium sp.]|jgi:excisionase family DNA binding protein|nr:helix-turn-helix domain-containing protein [Denitrobacterium sp.]
MEAAAIRSEQDAMILGMSRSATPVAGRRHLGEPVADDDALGEPLMDVSEVAAFLRVSKSMVYKLAEEDALHAVRIGRLVRFTRRDVDSFVRFGVS